LTVARQRVGIELEEIGREVLVDNSTLEALETGKLKANQIAHNFPAPAMLRMLRRLQIKVADFTKVFMDMVESSSGVNGYTEVQTAYRKHTADDVSSVAEVADYVAQLERLDRGS